MGRAPPPPAQTHGRRRRRRRLITTETSSSADTPSTPPAPPPPLHITARPPSSAPTGDFHRRRRLIYETSSSYGSSATPAPPPPSCSSATEENRRRRPLLMAEMSKSSLSQEADSQASGGPRHRQSTATEWPSASSSQATTESSESSSTTNPSQGVGNFVNWNGPGLHRFNNLEELRLSMGEMNRFLSRWEALCILQNPYFFLNNGMIRDARIDRERPDFEFIVITRKQFLELKDRVKVRENFWPGYKFEYHEVSEEKRISTLKLNEEIFLWRHEVGGSLLLRRRVSLDKDEGPFQDDEKVFYILQYQKLPRTKRSIKYDVLAYRASQGYL